MKQIFVLIVFLCSYTLSAKNITEKKEGAVASCQVVNFPDSIDVGDYLLEQNDTIYATSLTDISTNNDKNGDGMSLIVTDIDIPAEESASLQLIDMQRKLHNMELRNVFRWIGGIILTPISLLMTGVTLFALAFSHGSKTAALLVLLGGCAGVAGSVMLLVSAIKHQKQIKELSNQIKLAKK